MVDPNVLRFVGYDPEKVSGFAFERLQTLDGAAHLVNQALLLEGIEVDVADGQGNLDAGARHCPLCPHVRALLGFRRLLEFYRLLQRRIVELGNLVDGLQCLLGLVGDFFFGELFVVKLNDFLDRAHALAQIVADGNQFLDDDRGAGDGPHHHELPALDALGDGDFAFARQQRNGAHFAQIHAHGIVGFFERTGGEVQIRFALVRVILRDAFMVAALGETVEATRGYSILATLLMVMLGGAWVPTFLFPTWLQNLTVIVPTRWAIDGLDGMTWRGLGFSSALAPISVLTLFALLFGLVAVMRFRWRTDR